MFESGNYYRNKRKEKSRWVKRVEARGERPRVGFQRPGRALFREWPRSKDQKRRRNDAGVRVGRTQPRGLRPEPAGHAARRRVGGCSHTLADDPGGLSPAQHRRVTRLQIVQVS